ncbi:MAG: hypothetical protein IE880_00615 [Epsilonproteobacteria bacterium]|nr:hypothetical protein [Campylobacterota bacterium]
MAKINLKTFMFVAVPLLLIACSSDSSQKSNESTGSSPQEASLKIYDPCAMLNEKDIKEIFPGENIKITTHDEKPANPLGMRRCYWSAGETDMKFIQLAVSSDIESKMPVSEQFINNRAYIEKVKAISGVGDDAYYGGSGLKLGAGLHVLVKNKGVLIGIQAGLGFGNDDEKRHIEIEKSLAQKVINRL